MSEREEKREREREREREMERRRAGWADLVELDLVGGVVGVVRLDRHALGVVTPASLYLINIENR